VITHGTESGYHAHFRAHIPPCLACKSAHAAEGRARRAREKDLHGTTVCDLCLDVACYAEHRRIWDDIAARRAAA
jgi:hypothetical protein